MLVYSMMPASDVGQSFMWQMYNSLRQQCNVPLYQMCILTACVIGIDQPTVCSLVLKLHGNFPIGMFCILASV